MSSWVWQVHHPAGLSNQASCRISKVAHKKNCCLAGIHDHKRSTSATWTIPIPGVFAHHSWSLDAGKAAIESVHQTMLHIILAKLCSQIIDAWHESTTISKTSAYELFQNLDLRWYTNHLGNMNYLGSSLIIQEGLGLAGPPSSRYIWPSFIS